MSVEFILEVTHKDYKKQFKLYGSMGPFYRQD